MYVCMYVSMISHMAGAWQVPDAVLHSLHVVGEYSLSPQPAVPAVHARCPCSCALLSHILLVDAPGGHDQERLDFVGALGPSVLSVYAVGS